MKRIIQICALSIVTFSIYSCSKDSKTLEATSWTYNSTDETEVLKFTSKSNLTIVNTSDGTEITFDATYEYKHPNVTIHLLGTEVKGSVDGNKMTLEDMEDNGASRTYTKN